MPLPSRRWLRYNLRTLLVLVTVFCVWLAWQARIVRDRKAAITEITSGGRVYFSKQIATERQPPHVPFWRCWMGDEGVAFVVLRQSQALRMGLARTDQIQTLLSESRIHVELSAEDYYKSIGREKPWDFTGSGSLPMPLYSEWRAKHSGG